MIKVPVAYHTIKKRYCSDLVKEVTKYIEEGYEIEGRTANEFFYIQVMVKYEYKPDPQIERLIEALEKIPASIKKRVVRW